MTSSTEADRSCFCTTNAVSVPTDNGDAAGFIRKGYDTPDLRHFISRIWKELPQSAEKILKDSRSTTAAICNGPASQQFFVKRYNNRGLIHTLGTFAKTPRPFKAFKAAERLSALNLPCPLHIAAFALRRGGFIRSAFLMTVPLDNLIDTLELHAMVSESGESKREFFNCICRYLKTMHDGGLSHGDLKLSNIYARKDGDRLSYGVWDLDAAECHPASLNSEQRGLELARVAASYVEIGERRGQTYSLEKLCLEILDSYASAQNPDFDFMLHCAEKFIRKTKDKNERDKRRNQTR